MISFWEQESFTQYDALVIGGGIVGLTTAIELRQMRPEWQVAVLERGLFPSGASTRNAGFACFGSLTEILADAGRIGPQTTLEVIQDRVQGLHTLRQRLGDAAMGYQACGGYELVFAGSEHALEQIGAINKLLRPVFGRTVFERRDDLIEQFGFDKSAVLAVVANPLEGHIRTGRMMRALEACAAEHGVKMYTGATVTGLEQSGNSVLVQVNGTVELRAGRVGVCTNAFTPGLLPGLDIVPGRGQVLVTRPMPDLKFRGTFHFDEGYYYFRDLDDRVLFGGGRNLDFDEERTTAFDPNPRIRAELLRLLQQVVLPGHDVEIDMEWQGIMGFSSTKRPIVQRVSDRITVGFGCNGMGVALGSAIGRQTARLSIGD